MSCPSTIVRRQRLRFPKTAFAVAPVTEEELGGKGEEAGEDAVSFDARVAKFGLSVDGKPVKLEVPPFASPAQATAIDGALDLTVRLVWLLQIELGA